MSNAEWWLWFAVGAVIGFVVAGLVDILRIVWRARTIKRAERGKT